MKRSIPPERSPHHLFAWFAIVFAASVASELGNSQLVLFPGFLLTLGANETLIGIVVGVAGVVSIMGRPWMGRVMDTEGRKFLLLLGLGITALATFACAFVNEFGVLVVGSRIFQGLGQAMTMIAFLTYVSDRYPVQKRAQGLALFGISGMLPLAIGPAIGDYVLNVAGYRGVFLGASGLILLAFILALFLDPTSVHPRLRMQFAFWRLLRSRELLPIWIGTFILSTGFTAIFVFVSTYVISSSLGSIGPFFFTYGTAAVVWRLLFSWLPDRLGPARMILPGLSAYALGMVLLGVGGSQAILALAGLLAGLGHGISYPVMLTLSTLRSPDADRGTATAVFSSIFDAGLVLMAPVLGFTISIFGYRTMFWACAAVLIAGVSIITLLDRFRGHRTLTSSSA